MIRSCGSVALLGPLLSDEAKETPEWKSWVAHVQLLEFALRQEFSLSDAAELDRLVKAHHEKFLAVSCPPGIVCNTVRNTVCEKSPSRSAQPRGRCARSSRRLCLREGR